MLSDAHLGERLSGSRVSLLKALEGHICIILAADPVLLPSLRFKGPLIHYRSHLCSISLSLVDGTVLYLNGSL